MSEPIAVDDQPCVFCHGLPGDCCCDLWCGHADCHARAALFDDPEPEAHHGRDVADVNTRGLT